jgi:hypothetical protein
MKIGYLFLLLLSLLSTAVPAQEKHLSSRDFAYGIPLEVDGDGAIYSLPLPQEVYRYSTRSDLGDVRIFNGYGEVVPHMLQRGKSSKEAKREPVALRFFPLYRNEPWDNEVKRIHIADDGKGTIIDIERQPGEEERKAGPVDHYLVDASSVEAPIEKLMLDWDEVDEGFLTSVKVEYSNDLVHWQHLISEATLADLAYEGYRLSQKSITLPTQEARYYRISWPLGEKGLLLKSISAEMKPVTDEQPRQWLTLSPVSDANQNDVYHFTQPGHYPVDRIRVELPQSNTVVRARLFSRSDDDKAPWRLRYQGLLYSLVRDGRTLQNEAISLSSVSDTHWRLDVVQDGGGLGRGVPQLQMGWVPHRLLFVARGEAPFTLSFGAATVKPPVSDIAGLIAKLEKRQDDNGFIKLARAGGIFELGGESRLHPPLPPLPWKKWLLWAVLIFGVAVLAWMGRSLYRQMNTENGHH